MTRAKLSQFLPAKAPGIADTDAASALRWLRRRGGRADARELAGFWRSLDLTRGQGHAASRTLRALPGVHYTRPPGGYLDAPGIYEIVDGEAAAASLPPPPAPAAPRPPKRRGVADRLRAQRDTAILAALGADWMTTREVADATPWSVLTVISRLRVLEESGLVAIDPHRDGGKDRRWRRA